MEETAKAVQDVAKAAQKTIDAGVRFGGFLDKYLGPGFSHLGASFADWAQIYRYKNLLNLIDSVEEIHKSRRLKGKVIPILPKHAIPILQEASLEDDDTIRGMWAGLLANATDPNVQFKVRKLYIDILSSLEPLDAMVLTFLAPAGLNQEYGLASKTPLNALEIATRIGCDVEYVKLSLSNLFRHGLVIDAWEHTFESLGQAYSGVRVDSASSNFRIAHLGRVLLDGCKAL